MELAHRTNKASKSSSQDDDDVISTMPENVITNIIDRLWVEEAVRTSILSKKWRFKWTVLTRLVFNNDFFDCLSRKQDYDWKIIISRLLIHVKGPITKFVLDIPKDAKLDVDDINHWFIFLSRNGVKDFTLINYRRTTPLKLPSHLFSCLDLKHVQIYNCYFRSPPTFGGFPNLLSLCLYHVTDIGDCVEFITKSPLLETLMIDYDISEGKLKLVDILKLENLKTLSFPFHILEDVAITSSTIFQLGGYLTKLEALFLDLLSCKFIEEAGVTKWACTAFPCLKTLCLDSVDYSSSIMLSCAIEVIWGFPNLQTLTISSAYNKVNDPPPAFILPEVEKNTKLQLRSVSFNFCRGSENEVYLIKNVLACSPLLQDITIHAKLSGVFGGDNGKLMFALKLLELNRASPIAKVKLWF